MSEIDKMARELVDATPMPALVGTLADLKDYQQNVVVAYGKACARISARAALLTAPPGWKLVPEKPTRAMISAGHAYNDVASDDVDGPNPPGLFNAMLAAAPEVK